MKSLTFLDRSFSMKEAIICNYAWKTVLEVYPENKRSMELKKRTCVLRNQCKRRKQRTLNSKDQIAKERIQGQKKNPEKTIEKSRSAKLEKERVK